MIHLQLKPGFPFPHFMRKRLIKAFYTPTDNRKEAFHCSFDYLFSYFTYKRYNEIEDWQIDNLLLINDPDDPKFLLLKQNNQKTAATTTWK